MWFNEKQPEESYDEIYEDQLKETRSSKSNESVEDNTYAAFSHRSRFRDHALEAWPKATVFYMCLTVGSIGWYSLLIHAPMFVKHGGSGFLFNFADFSPRTRHLEYTICFLLSIVR